MDLQAILQRPVVGDEETVVIALHEPSWDKTLQRGTTGTFKSYPRKSCSRLSILTISEIIRLFRNEISGGRVRIEAYGTILVSTIKEIGQSGETKIEFEVTVDPTDTNAAHAEIVAFEPGKGAIRRKVTVSASDKLCEAMKVTILE